MRPRSFGILGKNLKGSFNQVDDLIGIMEETLNPKFKYSYIIWTNSGINKTHDDALKNKSFNVLFDYLSIEEVDKMSEGIKSLNDHYIEYNKTITLVEWFRTK